MSAQYRMNTKAVEAALKGAVLDSIIETGIAFQKETRLMLSRPGTGRLYRVAKGRKSAKTLRGRGLHRASAPGEPPAVDTGDLRRSFQYGGLGEYFDRTSMSDPHRPKARVGTLVRKASWLEYGTRNMAARPFVRPAMVQTQPRISKIIDSNVKRRLAAVRRMS